MCIYSNEWVFMYCRCCQNGLVSVWTVPQDPSSYSQSSTACPDAWWETESKSKLMVTNLYIFEIWNYLLVLFISWFIEAENYFYDSLAGPTAVWRSSVCVPAAGSHDSSSDSSIQSRWVGFSVWRSGRTFEHLVTTGKCLSHWQTHNLTKLMWLSSWMYLCWNM